MCLHNTDPDYSFLQELITKKQLYLSVITVAEFLSQASHGDELELDRLLSIFPALAIDVEIARLAGEYRKQFLKQKRAQLLDYFLAAQAKVHNLTLVTNNKSDFPMKGIKIISP